MRTSNRSASADGAFSAAELANAAALASAPLPGWDAGDLWAQRSRPAIGALDAVGCVQLIQVAPNGHFRDLARLAQISHRHEAVLVNGDDDVVETLRGPHARTSQSIMARVTFIVDQVSYEVNHCARGLTNLEHRLLTSTSECDIIPLSLPAGPFAPTSRTRILVGQHTLSIAYQHAPHRLSLAAQPFVVPAMGMTPAAPSHQSVVWKGGYRPDNLSEGADRPGRPRLRFAFQG